MRIGILTSGGDTPGMNAVIRGAYIRAKKLGHELVGIKYGWDGLMNGVTIDIPESIEESIDLGGTILFSSRSNPYAREDGLAKIRQTFEKLQLDACIAIGGEDTLGVANKLTHDGLPMVGVPKTIDNDLDATDYTFGFNTAYSIATDALDRAKTTARSHERILVLELMGRHAGWLTLYAGIAAGAHAILIPEFPLEQEEIIQIFKQRFTKGENWGIVAVSEGFQFTNTEHESATDEFGHVRLEHKEVGKQVANLLAEQLSIATRAITLGHIQRGGPPSAYDRVLSSRLGINALDLVATQQFGKMPALRGTSIVPVALEDAVARLKVVDAEHWLVARKLMGLD